tara:strand:+ start:588 stop:1709 length:1122 start_codon:yes stop_codon:yes gene_type:complete
MKQSSTHVKSIDFSAANLPTFEEVVNNKDWVYWGSDNLWPKHSIDLWNYSSVLRSSLNSIRDAVVGKDLLIDGKSGNLLMANSMESVYDVFKRVVVDFVVHNGFSLNTILRKDKQGIAEFYHMDISKLRSGKSDMMDRVLQYWFCSDWTNTRKFIPVEMPAFNLQGETASQIYLYKSYQPAQFYYPVNEWIACRMAAEIDTEIKNYHLNNLRNGYHSGTVFSMNNGVPSEEERDSIYRHLEERYTSTNNAGQVIVTFSDDKEHEPTITPFVNSATPDMFIQLNEMIQQTILTACRISNPTLLGIKTVQGLGSKDEMVDAYEHFLATVVKPIQEKLIREFEKILFIQTGEIRRIEIVQNELFDLKDKPEIEGIV